MRGDAVGQGQPQAAQPGLLGATEGGHVLEAFGARQGGAQGDGQDVAQQVGDETGVTGVLHGSEVVADVQAFGEAHQGSLGVGGGPPRIAKRRRNGYGARGLWQKGRLARALATQCTNSGYPVSA